MKSSILIALTVFAAPSFGASPAEKAITQALRSIEKQPDHYQYHNNLAMAYARRARETSDVQYYGRAEESLKRSFVLSPGNFEGLKVEAWLQLGRHEFGKALETATRLNRIAPDDLAVYGYLVDANIELGRYKEAVAAAQWMLDIRPGNVAGLVRAGYLRELHGNLSGALDLMQMAYDSAAPSETEDRSWLLTQLAHLHLLSGDLAQAATCASGALAAFPDYHYALAALAQVRTAEGKYSEAVALLAKRYRAAPHAENLYALAEAQELAGMHDDAKTSFAEFEARSREESGQADNSNHELIFYYIDHAGDSTKALQIARREVERRQDVFTLDAYAWALAANGDYRAADAQMRKALSVGVKDPRLLYHAGAIALHLRQTDKAAAYLNDAASRHSREAATLLRTLAQGS